MTGKWVCKPDGRIQCQDNPEIPLDTMRKQLAAIVGDDNILDQKKITVITPKMCGIPAGTMNAYDLSEFGYELLHNGFVGPMGFRDCPGDGQHAMPGVTDQAGTEPNFATGVAFTGISSAGSTPTLVRDLIGHRVRVYEQGSPVTLDLIFGRVNVVTKDHVIADIWFG
jgi:hypothetical protein